MLTPHDIIIEDCSIHTHQHQPPRRREDHVEATQGALKRQHSIKIQPYKSTIL